MQIKRFKDKLRKKIAVIGVVGLGYVGLPLAVAFAKKGYRVIGVDLDKAKVIKLGQGESYILDVPSNDIKSVIEKNCLKVSSDFRSIASADALIICVPTPLNKTKEPDISCVVDASKKISGNLKKGQLIVLESTTYPGTTDEIMLPILEKTGLKAEKDFFLAFSPERVDPGNQNYDTTSIPKVVGGVGPHSLEAATALYESIIRTVVTVSSSKTAEMAKLLENTFRSVNIGLINEMAVMCDRLGIDIWEVIEAAKTKPFGFMPFYPGPGIGGHCLPIDPLYLSWKSKRHGFQARLIELAAETNEAMPRYVVERITRMLNRRERSLKGASILILGVAYKKDVDDLRESAALDVIEYLLEEGAKVFYVDPFVRRVTIKRHVLKSNTLTPEFIRSNDCSVILVDHTSVDYEILLKHSKMILDTRNVMGRYKPHSNLFSL